MSATDDLVGAWPSVVRTLKATVRALYSAVDVVGLEGDTLVLSAPSDMHKKKCLELKDQVLTALTTAAGRPISIDVRVQASRGAAPRAAAASKNVASPEEANYGSDHDSDENDVSDESVESVVDHIAKQFPGARVVDSPKK